ncbi:MAG: ribonuclease III domain-containing protein [Erysipelotrichaceae bacterium]
MEASLHNGTTLAFIGDALMSLKVRVYLMEQGFERPDILQKKASMWVSAKAQAYMLENLIEQNFFNEDEMSIMKRGRNASIGTKAKNADIRTYRLSTGMEAIWGYLYLSNQEERLETLWSAMKVIGEKR